MCVAHISFYASFKRKRGVGSFCGVSYPICKLEYFPTATKYRLLADSHINKLGFESLFNTLFYSLSNCLSIPQTFKYKDWGGQKGEGCVGSVLSSLLIKVGFCKFRKPKSFTENKEAPSTAPLCSILSLLKCAMNWQT